VAAFVAAGGRAEWDFIVFRHNEHQVEEARALAKELGFQRFFVKKTSRHQAWFRDHRPGPGDHPAPF
jgi:hypothetical protein